MIVGASAALCVRAKTILYRAPEQAYVKCNKPCSC